MKEIRMEIPTKPIKKGLYRSRSAINTMFFWNRTATAELQGDMPLKEFTESDIMIEAYHAKYNWFDELKPKQREFLITTYPEIQTWKGMREVWKNNYSE